MSSDSSDGQFDPVEFLNLVQNSSDEERNATEDRTLARMIVRARQRRRYEGESSQPRERRHRQYIDRERENGHERLVKDYFSEAPPPVYSDQQFRRRFRMRRPLFLRIVNELSTKFDYFRQRRNAAGRLGLSPLQKCTASIRMLAYGISADSVDEYLRMGVTTARQCLTNFVEGVISLFGDVYLRRPNTSDMQRLLHVAEERGFPGMIGSIDCMHWEWKNCPTGWRGQFARGHGKPTIILEAVASYDLWIWHAFFGTPGSCNDINVLDRSPVFDDVLNGISPPVNFTVNGNEYNMSYYLTDGIYPPWPVFIPSIRLPRGDKDSHFAKRQEAYRKDVERAFGVLQARFAIVKNPALAWDINFIGKIMRACIILHNMIVEDERDTYSLYYDPSQFEQSGVADNTYTPSRPISMVEYISNRQRLRNKSTHEKLKEDLIEHVWEKSGHFYVRNL